MSRSNVLPPNSSNGGLTAQANNSAKRWAPKTEKLPPVDHGYAWVIVAVATVVFMFEVGTFRAQSVFLEPVREKFNVTHGTMTLMSSAMVIVSQLVTLPGNVMNEWLGPRVNVGVAGVCGIVCYIICAFAPVFPIYFASFVLFQGSAFALCYSPVVVTVNRYFKVYRPLASSIALGGVSVGTMVIPNALRVAIKYIGLRWVLICASVFMAITIPVGLFLRPITMEQLALLDAQHNVPPPPPPTAEEANEHSEGNSIEFVTMPNGKAPAPIVIGANGMIVTSNTDKRSFEKLLTAPPMQSQVSYGQNGVTQKPEAVDLKKEEPKKKSNIAAAFAYFKNMPPLFKNLTYLIHALHFAVIMSVDLVLVSVSFDSFTKEMKIKDGLVFTMQTVFATGNFVGRFASGLFVVMPVLIANCRRGKQDTAAPSGTSCYDKLRKYLTVRVLYCGASAIFCVVTLLLALAGLSGGQQWSLPLVIIYTVVGLSSGCLFSQFPVVLAELVGVQRLAAGHALFMLIQVPVSALPFMSGMIKSGTGSWAIAYMILFIISTVITIVDSASLLLSDYIHRLCCRKSTQEPKNAV